MSMSVSSLYCSNANLSVLFWFGVKTSLASQLFSLVSSGFGAVRAGPTTSLVPKFSVC